MRFLQFPGPEYEWQPVPVGAVIALNLFFAFTIVLYWRETYYLDACHLVTHEWGHEIFGILLPGHFMRVAGGTLFQLLVPLMLAYGFAYRGQIPGIAFCVFMFFNSLINVGIYMADARSHALQLVAPGATGDQDIGHDWDYLLRAMNLYQHDMTLGRITRGIGWIGMAAVMLWLVWMWRTNEDRVARNES